MYKLLVALSLVITSSAMAQSAADLQSLQQQEAVIAPYAKDMIFAPLTEDRLVADSTFTRLFVKALRTPYSFNYPFDSIITVSKLYAPDSSFRIFTWQFERDESYFRQRGAIQMKTKDGSLKLFPLLDASQFTTNPTDSVRSNTNWIGAIYYNIIEKQYQGKKYYTLFGYDDNDFASTRKWVDVLTFDNAGNPHFGGKYFNYPEDSIKPAQPAYRFCLEYKKDARARINYDPEMDMIIFDHLISESNHQSEKYTLIPDGDYEGFKWKDGKWNYVEKVFDFKLEDGQAPIPEPIKDDAGNTNEKILQEQSQKNERRKP
ncbi:hypothetical protein FC093_04370 [Ilyomonas limi]|uniref:Uncharacterized protein n=1 Tax=Ilyomonas limi TaxID=2575867 RepID=A0A4U3L7C7_9BACT|nr:hypothetical protein [Ilyomonas limi]TKK70932.1 hypothetical protein FC093_04370 [Ilyomonas limi]